MRWLMILEDSMEKDDLVDYDIHILYVDQLHEYF